MLRLLKIKGGGLLLELLVSLLITVKIGLLCCPAFDFDFWLLGLSGAKTFLS